MSKLAHPSETDPHYAWFQCPACLRHHAVSTNPATGWTWNGDAERPTLMPSVKVTGGAEPGYCCHSYVTDGRIQFLDDCSHALRGWHDLPEMLE